MLRKIWSYSENDGLAEGTYSPSVKRWKRFKFKTKENIFLLNFTRFHTKATLFELLFRLCVVEQKVNNISVLENKLSIKSFKRLFIHLAGKIYVNSMLGSLQTNLITAFHKVELRMEEAETRKLEVIQLNALKTKCAAEQKI